MYYINACVYSPAGDLLVTASSDNMAKLWSTASWNCVGMFISHHINSAHLVWTQSYVLGTVLTAGTLTGHEGAVRHCAFSPDGNLIATASADSDVRVWEVGGCKCIATLTRHNSDSRWSFQEWSEIAWIVRWCDMGLSLLWGVTNVHLMLAGVLANIHSYRCLIL